LQPDTTGTDFAISSSGTTHSFNLPSSSASNRGLLLAMDWVVFNAKIGGSGTIGQIPYMSASATITTESGSGANSLAWDASNNRLGIGTASPTATLHSQGSSVLFQNAGPLSLTLNDSSNGNVPAVYFKQGGTTRATIEAGVGLSAGLFFSSGTTRLMSFGYGINSSSKFGRTYAGSTSGPVDGIAVEGLSGFGILAPAAKIHAVGAGSTSSTYTAQLHNSTGTNNAFVVRDDGLTGHLTSAPTSTVDVNGVAGYAQLRLRTTYTPTSSADALGSTGDTSWDANYFYIKTAAGWKRSALSTF
jgi:hypothetical protein